MDNALYGWITVAYMVASTVFVPIYGKLSDIYGRKPILLIGMTVFLLGSIACGLSQSWQMLVASRAVQGLGSAALFTTAFAVVADIFPPAVRGKYTGIFAGVWGVTSVIGPFLGGFLTDTLSWHWVFFINLPIGLVAIAFVVARMPRLGGGARRGVDVVGAIALAVFVVPLLIALTLGSRPGSGPEGGGPAMAWSDPTILGLFATAVFGFIAFIAIERRVEDPLLDLRLFKVAMFRWGTLAMFVVGMAFFTAIVFLPLYMQQVLHLSATRSGLAMTPMTLGVVAGNIASGQLVTRIGRYKGVMLVSLIALIGAFAVVALTLSSDTSTASLTGKMVLVGLALGPAVPLYTLAIQNGAKPHEVGVVTAAATFARQIGGTIGTAILMTVFSTVVAVRAGANESFAQAMTAGMVAVFWTGAGFALLAVLITLAIPQLPLRKTNR
jgi:EmrB/QacA subfamily drug resistance transporter